MKYITAETALNTRSMSERLDQTLINHAAGGEHNGNFYMEGAHVGVRTEHQDGERILWSEEFVNIFMPKMFETQTDDDIPF